MNLFFNDSHIISYSIILLLSVALSGCHKPAPETKVEPAEAQQASVVVPDLNQICEDLKKEMLAITSQRTTFALEQINQNIRVCLPLISHREQKKLMDLSNQMYNQFLYMDRTPEQQKAFDQYALDESQFPTIQQSHFEKLNSRDQYLLRHKGQAYIELSNLNQNNMSYKRNAQYLAKVFAPYFPLDEKEFIQGLADQNEMPSFNQNSLLISPEDIVQRVLFWESYLKKFPQSAYKKDAQYLYDTYRSLLFLGLKDSPVSINFDGKFDIQAASLAAIESLAELKDSAVATQSRQFLKFIDMSTEQKAQYLNRSNADHSNSSSAQKQIMQLLNLKVLDFSQKPKRDCFSDAICH